MSHRMVQKRPRGGLKTAGLLEEPLKKPLQNPLKKHRRIVASQRCGSFADIRTEVLQSAADIEAWRLAAMERFGTFGREADRLIVQAAAVHALRLGKNPPALFVETLRHPERITIDDEDEGRRRLRELSAGDRSHPSYLAELGINATRIFRRVDPLEEAS